MKTIEDIVTEANETIDKIKEKADLTVTVNQLALLKRCGVEVHKLITRTASPSKQIAVYRNCSGQIGEAVKQIVISSVKAGSSAVPDFSAVKKIEL